MRSFTTVPLLTPALSPPSRTPIADVGNAAAAAAAASAISRSYRVPEGDVGKIIGKAGATIKTLRQRSGASVQLAERGPGKFPAPRLIELRGTAEAVALAKQMLESMCSSVTPAR